MTWIPKVEAALKAVPTKTELVEQLIAVDALMIHLSDVQLELPEVGKAYAANSYKVVEAVLVPLLASLKESTVPNTHDPAEGLMHQGHCNTWTCGESIAQQARLGCSDKS